MRDNMYAQYIYIPCIYIHAEQILWIYTFMIHVIQASIASSHRVGKCIFEPSKQSRIRKSSFWSHRRSTVQWETALSSKERSRRVNCPILVHYKYKLLIITHIYPCHNYLFTMRQWQAVTVEYNYDECLALPPSSVGLAVRRRFVCSIGMRWV